MPTLSRERLKVLIASGAVSQGEVLARDPAKRAAAGATFAVAVPVPAAPHNEAQDIPLVIAYEDEHLIVVDKPAGLVVHPAAGNLDGTLVNALLHHCRGSLSGIGGVARPGIVPPDRQGYQRADGGRQDRPRDEGLAKQFAAHSIDRRYKAITGGVPRPAAGTVDAPLGGSPQNRKKIAIVAGGKRAVTHFTTIQPLRDSALVECGWRRGGGRIRSASIWRRSAMRCSAIPSMAAQGVDADGDGSRSDFKRQALHAALIGFIHPISGVKMAFESAMPPDMQELFSHLHV